MPGRILMLFAGVLLLSGAARARVPGADGGESGAALQAAVAASPALDAARARLEAARARVGAAARLPDPELEVMASRADMPQGDATMWELNLRQPLPRAGERRADLSRAQAVVLMAEAEFAMKAGELAMEVSMAAAEAEGAERRIALLEAQVARMRTVLASIDARLASGSGRLADHLTVQSGIATMRLMIEEERRMAGDARSEMLARLGSGAGSGIPAFAAPAPEAVSATENAAVRLAAAREAEAAAMKAMAQTGGRPMTAVGLRLEREQSDMGSEDRVGVAFMTALPWRSARYARSEIRAANAEASAARSDAEVARLRVDAALTRSARAAALAATARQLGAETRARLDAEFDSLVRALAAGPAMDREPAVLMIVEILEKVTETELRVIDAEIQECIARAGLWPHLRIDRWAAAADPSTYPQSPNTP